MRFSVGKGESLGALVNAWTRKVVSLILTHRWVSKNYRRFHEEKHGINWLDIDYYTIATTGVGQLHIGEWISQVAHLVRRDGKAFLGRFLMGNAIGNVYVKFSRESEKNNRL